MRVQAPQEHRPSGATYCGERIGSNRASAGQLCIQQGCRIRCTSCSGQLSLARLRRQPVWVPPSMPAARAGVC